MHSHSARVATGAFALGAFFRGSCRKRPEWIASDRPKCEENVAPRWRLRAALLEAACNRGRKLRAALREAACKRHPKPRARSAESRVQELEAT